MVGVVNTCQAISDERSGHIRSSGRSEEFGRSDSEVGYAPVVRSHLLKSL